MTNQKVDKSKLAEAIQVAKERKDAQEAWNALEVKVPEYAPWAPHGYARLMSKYEEAIKVNENKDAIQDEVSTAAAGLNAAINSMRPGNLPELEDMDKLFQLMREVRRSGKEGAKVKEAMDYAGMVVEYVGDGSGTMDMITKACDQLEAVLK